MKIQLEVMEIAWLANIKARGGRYVLSDAHGILTELQDFGLIATGYDEGLFITGRGEEVFRKHQPLVYFADLNSPVPLFKSKSKFQFFTNF